MGKIIYYVGKYKLLIFLFVILIILIVKTVLNINPTKDKINNLKTPEKEEVQEIKKEEEKKVNTKQKFKVDIKGLVLNPGVYEVDSETRVLEVINMAGGLLEQANTEYLNLSKKVKDEMVIIIYSNEEIEDYKQGKKSLECECPDNINDACIKNEDIITNTSSNNINEGLISINEATQDQLTKLPGIGESKAKDIIEYREKNGGFKSIEEIKNVSGIGDALYSKIKDYIEL